MTIILGITIPSIINGIKKSKEQELARTKDMIIAAARNYVIDYSIETPQAISIESLCDDDYLKCPIKNNLDNTFINGYVIIDEDKNYSYSDTDYLMIRKRINPKLNNARYIKDCVNGNTVNHDNHWVELQAMYNGTNVAYGRTVTGTVSQNASYPYSRITDGDINYGNYAMSNVNGSQCITVDLGQIYNLDEIMVWHYYNGGRTYHSNITYLSSNNSLWIEVINETAPETSDGKRISAYEKIINGYIGTGLVLLYDGISNTGIAHSSSATTWKNLASTSYTGTLNGATWGTNYLSFDGINDWVSIGILNNDYATLESVYSCNGINADGNVIIGNPQNGGIYIGVSPMFLLRTGVYVSGSYTHLYGPVLEQNKMYNSTGIYNGENIYLYQNASQVASAATSGVIGIPASSTIMALGTNPGGSSAASEYLNGKIYSVRIYNRALTANEVKHNYEFDKIRFGL